ncbi:MAG: glycosyltransferase family 2 protein [Gemmatimonadetes bacterium]|nr:glycosyltransferase family 2 protein [Gemmatimonadota bacterium]
MIVVSYNTRELTRRCLESASAVVASLGGELWVVDNASGDGTAAMVQGEFPRVQLIAKAKNVGYGTANNEAMRRAAGSRFLLVNSDVELTREAVDELMVGMDADRRTALVGACLVAPNGRPRPSARRFPGPLRELVQRFRLYRLLPRGRRGLVLLGEHASGAEAVEPDWVTGACLLVRREAFEETGGFDESIFMYGEELEWCARLRRLGWRIGYARGARVLHVGRASSESALGRRRLALSLEGDLRYLARFRGRWALWAFVVIRASGLAFEAALGALARSREARELAAYQLREHLRLGRRYLSDVLVRQP